jgi:oligogalacturonide transport system substrate-binding protein
MKKALVVLGLLVVVLAMATGCRNEEESGTGRLTLEGVEVAAVTAPTPRPENWQLNNGNPATIIFEWWGGDARHNALNAAVNAFTARYSHINVQVRYGAFDGYLNRLIMDLVAGTEADVLQSNFAWVHALAEGYNPFANHLTLPYLDLTEWTDDLRAFTTTREGELAGVPHGITGRVVIYNQRILRDAGLSTFPATWDELIRLGTQIAANNATLDDGGNEYIFFPVGNESWDIILMTMILNEFGVNLQADGRILPTIDQVEQMFQVLGEAINVGALPTFVQQEAPLNTTNPVWMTGRGGGLFEWVGNIFLAGGNFMDNSQADRRIEGVGIALLPAVTAGTTQNSMQRPSLVHAVSQGSIGRGVDNVAAYFLNWLYTDNEALTIIGGEFGVPLGRSAAAVAAREGSVWGLMADGLDLLTANQGNMCHLFEDPNLRPERFAAIEAFRSGAMDSRQAATAWVNNQQSALNALR